MACTSITDIVVRESGRYLADEIFNRNFTVSPWMTLVRRGSFPGAMGEELNVLTYERSAPTASPTWTQVATVDGAEGGACLPDATKIGIASTTRSFGLYRHVLEGPDFCAEDCRTAFELGQQLNRVAGILAEYARITWEMKDRLEYFLHCLRKVVVNAALTNTATMASTYPAAQPTSALTQGVLDTFYLKLLRDGAGQSAMARLNGAPQLVLITSAEMSNRIIVENNTNIRADLRDAAPDKLLLAMGAGQSYKNFVHVIDPYPRRFEYSGGTFTEVQPFTTAAATKGTKTEVNSSWETATYEESFIFDPTVFTQMVPQPVVNPAPNFRFDPVRYTGAWKAMNIPDRKCNPDGNILYHRGILAAGSMPVHPERGVAFVHLRCPPTLGLVNCS